jgi:hypothetical protein
MRGLARTTCRGCGCGAEERDRVPCREGVVEPAEFGDPVDREARSVAVAAEAFCDNLGELGFDCRDRRARPRLWPRHRR